MYCASRVVSPKEISPMSRNESTDLIYFCKFQDLSEGFTDGTSGLLASICLKGERMAGNSSMDFLLHHWVKHF
jgi:hypothetical protein